MNTTERIEEAIEVLQQLGLKEYEARCFVGLSRLHSGTAKQLSDMTEVPRTRVYDAVRVLEAQGLVEIHHSSPQQFRAVPLDEAVETLRDQYENRVGRLRDTLTDVDTLEVDEETPVQEVWSMAGQEAIENRAEQLIRDATEEVVLIIGDDSLYTDELVASLSAAHPDIELVVGTLTEELEERVRTDIPIATTFVSELDWLQSQNVNEGDTAIGRLLLVDRTTFLVSSIMPESKDEKAIFGRGFGNGLIVIARRIMAEGLVSARDPSK